MVYLSANGDGGGVAIVVDLYGRREGRKSVAVKGGPKTGSYGWCEKVNSHFFLRHSLDADLKRNKKDLDHSNSSKLFVKIRPNEIAKSSN